MAFCKCEGAEYRVIYHFPSRANPSKPKPSDILVGAKVAYCLKCGDCNVVTLARRAAEPGTAETGEAGPVPAPVVQEEIPDA